MEKRKEGRREEGREGERGSVLEGEEERKRADRGGE